MSDLLLLMPLLPMLGFLILALFGGRMHKTAIAWIGTGSVGVTSILVFLIGYKFLHSSGQVLQLNLGSWIAVEDLTIPFGYYLDALSLTMLFIVTGVGFLIHLYAAQFMLDDAGYARFFACMNLFVAAMLVLVLADNLVLLYLGWEGVGLGSYLLIGFWYQEPNNVYAARKAFVMTRIGDTSLIVGIFLLFTHLGTLDIQMLMQNASTHWQSGSYLPVLAAALILGGAIGKSAQLPLQTWLPDAMAGPTPVSALIHAATMVTAGVYLIARMHELFLLAPSVQNMVALIGTLTLLIAGCSALAQNDIKRILAYSTISQIGYMFLALGVGAWSAAIFHLFTHAFFKALLFLAAGAVIYCCHHEHDIFKMGGLRKAMPLTFWSFLIGCAALSALPFTSGYYSKHEILQTAYQISPVIWAAGCLGAFITGLYSFRLVFIVFFGELSLPVDKKTGWHMNFALATLSFLALAGAMFRIPLSTVYQDSAATAPEHGFNWPSAITVLAPVAGLLLASLLYLTKTISAQRLAENRLIKPFRLFFYDGWYFDMLYQHLLIRPYTRIARLNKNDVVDLVYIGIERFSQQLHGLISATQTGHLRWYATSMFLGTAVLLAIGLLS